MPMSDYGSSSSATEVSADTAVVDTVPLREAPASRPRTR